MLRGCGMSQHTTDRELLELAAAMMADSPDSPRCNNSASASPARARNAKECSNADTITAKLWADTAGEASPCAMACSKRAHSARSWAAMAAAML